MKTHVLFESFPLCMFSTSVPKDWPDGHQWCAVEDAAAANCDRCKEALVELLAARQTEERRVIAVAVQEPPPPLARGEAVALSRSVPGLFLGSEKGEPIVRLSALLRSLEGRGQHAIVAELRALAAKAGAHCPTCMVDLPDPIIAMLGQNIAFGCPGCSGAEVRRQWEAQGLKEEP